MKDYSSLLDLKGRFNTLTDSKKKDILLYLVMHSEINIDNIMRNELITAFLKECPEYTEFYNNISLLNSGLENIKLRYNSIT